MPAYLMVQYTAITDAAQYDKYRAQVRPLIASHGGRPVIIAATPETLEGEADSRPMTVFEFPSMEKLHAFWHSPEYVPVKALRQGAATLHIWAVPGV